MIAWFFNRRMKQHIARVFSILDDIQKLFFTMYLKRDYQENGFQYEKKLYFLVQRYFCILDRQQSYSSDDAEIFIKKIISLFNILFEQIITLGNLRYQVQDFSTFEVCSSELLAISENISLMIRSIINNIFVGDKKEKISFDGFSASLESFKQVYEGTLRVVSKDPVVFLIFIKTLSLLEVKLKECANLVVPNIHHWHVNWSLSQVLPVLPRRVLAVLCALIIAGITAYLVPMPQSYWIVISIFIVAQTIIGNLIIFPRRADVIFRHSMILILNGDAKYLSAIFNRLVQKEQAEQELDYSELEVEKMMLKNNLSWVYEPGFNRRLRIGHRHFLTMVERCGLILFSMCGIARQQIDAELINSLQSSLKSCFEQMNLIFQALITVLKLNKLTEKVSDLSLEMDELEKTFKKVVPLSVELIDISDDYIYLAALLQNMKDLQSVLVRLAEALR